MSGPLFRMEFFLIRSGSKLCLSLPKNKIHPHSEATQSALMSELGNEAGSYFFCHIGDVLVKLSPISLICNWALKAVPKEESPSGLGFFSLD